MSVATSTERPASLDEAGEVSEVFYTADNKSVRERIGVTKVMPETRQFLAEAISRIYTRDEEYIVQETKFEGFCAETKVVPTIPGDTIVFALRPHRRWFSRFVVSNATRTSQEITVVIKERKEELNDYMLIAAWVGGNTPPELDDLDKLNRRRLDRSKMLKAERRSFAFWKTHAFVLEKTTHIVSSITKETPPEWQQILLPR